MWAACFQRIRLEESQNVLKKFQLSALHRYSAELIFPGTVAGKPVRFAAPAVPTVAAVVGHVAEDVRSVNWTKVARSL